MKASTTCSSSIRSVCIGHHRGIDRFSAAQLDAADPLATMRDLFRIQPGPIYMDGNSLGRPPTSVVDAIREAATEWADRLVGGWDDWIDLPSRVGDRLGRLIGAAPGQLLVCDSTTINLYKLAAAALAARPDRRNIVALTGDFPTDRYILQSLGRELRAADDLEAAIDDETALVCASHVHFATGRRLDAARITRVAHDHGALVLWDLAHSAGAVPVALDDWHVDLAVGCTYKYLNAGPGAPGYLYVNARLQDELRQPIWGWFGQADQFAMGERYTPASGITRFMTGTPGIIGLRAVDAALAVTEEAGVDALWAKSAKLTALLADRAKERLEPLGATVIAPDERGAHISVAHPDAWRWCRALIDGGLVVGDFRPPDMIRLGPAPLYTRYVDCFDAIEALADRLERGLQDAEPRRVT